MRMEFNDLDGLKEVFGITCLQELQDRTNLVSDAKERGKIESSEENQQDERRSFLSVYSMEFKSQKKRQMLKRN